MFRLFCSFICMMILSGCNSIIIKKRRYFKGYYVHFPLGRNSSPQKYKRDIIPHTDSIPVAQNDTSGFNRVTTTSILDSVPAADSICMFFVNTEPRRDTAPAPGSLLFALSGVRDTIGSALRGDSIRFISSPFSSGQSIPVNSVPYIPGSYIPDSLQYIQEFEPVDSLAQMRDDDTCMLFVNSVPRKHKQVELETELFGFAGLHGFQTDRTYAVNPNSFNTGFGLRFKTKATAKSEFIGSLGFGLRSFSVNQNRPKSEPFSATIHDRERLSIGGGHTALGFRYHLPDREKVINEFGSVEKIKRHIDLEATGDLHFYTSNKYTDRYSDAASPSGKNYRIKTRITDLPYISNTGYGVSVRYVRNNIGYFANYRISSLLRNTPSGIVSDLPKLTLGMEFMIR